jgi:hypothetical protein
MANIDGLTLGMAIQAMDFQIRTLEKQVDETDGPDAVDLEDLLMRYMTAAEVLRRGYEEECAVLSNLPPYERLVR